MRGADLKEELLFDVLDDAMPLKNADVRQLRPSGPQTEQSSVESDILQSYEDRDEIGGMELGGSCMRSIPCLSCDQPSAADGRRVGARSSRSLAVWSESNADVRKVLGLEEDAKLTEVELSAGRQSGNAGEEDRIRWWRRGVSS